LKRSIRFRIALLFLAITFLPFTRQIGLAQEAPAQTQSAPAQQNPGASTSTTKAEDEEENAAFRHSAMVKTFAGWMHLDIETAAKIFEDLNSGLLILAILWFLFKVMPKAFRKRNETIQKQLVEARTATEEANERLGIVERRLARLDDEIEAIRKTVDEESAGDEARIKQSLEEERKRIVESAEHEIEAASAAAQRHLKQFAAELAVERAVRGLKLSADDDRRLVESFGRDLGRGSANGGRN
jgi:F-type H+-transporting ATPase subunit b